MQSVLKHILSGTLVLLLMVGVGIPRTLGAISTCCCSASAVAVENASSQVLAPEAESCCGSTSLPVESDPLAGTDGDLPSPLPCDCPAFCCGGKLISLPPSLPSPLDTCEIIQHLRVQVVTVISINYHADILRPPRA